jgi:hypothetical protein
MISSSDHVHKIMVNFCLAFNLKIKTKNAEAVDTRIVDARIVDDGIILKLAWDTVPWTPVVEIVKTSGQHG